ncbi:HEAT repeat domain-containing protein, partial [Methanohalobium sp.]|uniref:HEAT repeat domain-containing protein n=1 Tax=Methanohalobium sp. TaxID=2837493 RepID=UPI0025E6A458
MRGKSLTFLSLVIIIFLFTTTGSIADDNNPKDDNINPIDSKSGADNTQKVNAETTNKDEQGFQINIPGVFTNYKNDKSTDSLIKDLLNSSNEDTRIKAAKALGEKRSQNAIDSLIKAFEDESVYVKIAAANSLGKIGNPATEELLEVLDSHNEDVRKFSVKALEDIKNDNTVDELSDVLLNDKSSDVRESAAKALGNIGDKRAAEPLINALLNDTDEDVRSNSAVALGKIKNENAVKPLSNALLNDKSSDVRESAAKALGNIGDKRAAEPLINAL